MSMSIIDAHLSRAPSPIIDLPIEVLLMIFDWTNRAQGSSESMPDKDVSEFYSGVDGVCGRCFLKDSPTRTFPFVCRKWLEVYSMRPEHWGHLYIGIDSPGFIPSVIETFFVASRDSPIKVSIRPRELDAYPLTADEEYDRLGFIMKCMVPHLGRLSCLTLHTYFRSTIVFISRFLDGNSLPVDRLELVSHQTNDVSPLAISTLRCPLLHSLHIDAESFINLMMNIDVDGLFKGGNYDIHITKYRPEPLLPAASPARLMDAFKMVDERSHMWFVSIKDVSFDPSDLPSDIPSLQNVMRLDLASLEGPFFLMICQATKSSIELDEIHIERCESPTPRPLPAGNFLTMLGISSGISLLHMLQVWEGYELIIYDCPGFDDWFLGALSLRNATDGSFACPLLTHLELNGHGFSAGALRRMCEMRYGCPDARIHSLHVASGSELDDDSRRWFESHVEEFEWKEMKMSETENMEMLDELLSSVTCTTRLARST